MPALHALQADALSNWLPATSIERRDTPKIPHKFSCAVRQVCLTTAVRRGESRLQEKVSNDRVSQRERNFDLFLAKAKGVLEQ
eukprot:4245165-Pleurochrysis_carterae.AAC.1